LLAQKSRKKFRGRSSPLLRGIHVKPTYTIDKALGIFFGKGPL
jgi:hypothetical protein